MGDRGRHPSVSATRNHASHRGEILARCASRASLKSANVRFSITRPAATGRSLPNGIADESAEVGQHRPYSQSPIAVIRSGDAGAKTRWSRICYAWLVLLRFRAPVLSEAQLDDAVRTGGLQVPGHPARTTSLSARNGQHGHDLDRIARENGKMRMLIE